MSINTWKKKKLPSRLYCWSRGRSIFSVNERAWLHPYPDVSDSWATVGMRSPSCTRNSPFLKTTLCLWCYFRRYSTIAAIQVRRGESADGHLSFYVNHSSEFWSTKLKASTQSQTSITIYTYAASMDAPISVELIMLWITVDTATASFLKIQRLDSHDYRRATADQRDH